MTLALNSYKLERGSAAKTSEKMRAFTLIELLIVLFIFLLLSAIALPIVRKLLVDQKASQSARAVASYITLARNRAIAEGRYVGIRIERIIANSNKMEYGASASIRLRQLVGTPPYSGDASDSKVLISSISNGIATLLFDKADNQLLSLNSSDTNVQNPIFFNRDVIEFPTGKQFHLNFGSSTATQVSATINLRSPVDGSISNAGTQGFPMGNHMQIGSRYSYRIYRSPDVSSALPLSLVRGVVIDLNYSGMGISGHQFEPGTTVNQPIDMLFGPDGRVEYISQDSAGTMGPPSGLIFLCIGSSDGVRDFEQAGSTNESVMFVKEGKKLPNILSQDSVWVVINPSTGRAVASPFATAMDTTSRSIALRSARSLALLSDTLDNAP